MVSDGSFQIELLEDSERREKEGGKREGEEEKRG